MRSTFYVGLWGFLYFCFVFGNEKQCLFCLFQLGTEILGKDQENRNCRFVSVKINILFAPNSCAVSSLFSLSCKHSQLSYRFQNSQWFSPLFRLGLFHLTYPPPTLFYGAHCQHPKMRCWFPQLISPFLALLEYVRRIVWSDFQRLIFYPF